MLSEASSLLDEFQLTGLWWLPRNRTNKLSGTVSFQRDSGITAQLVGDLMGSIQSPVMMNKVGWSEPIIQGLTTDGKNVTLQDNYSTSSTLHFPGMPVQDLASAFLFVGDCEFGSEQDIRFASLMLNLNCLEEWVGRSPFFVDRAHVALSGRGASALYQPLEIPPTAVPSLAGEIRIVEEFVSKSDRRSELRWSCYRYLEIVPNQILPWEWFLDAIVGMSDLLTLFMWQPIYPRRVVGLGEDLEKKRSDGRNVTKRNSTEIFWHFLTPQIDPGILEDRVLLRLGDIQSSLPSILDSWFSKRKKLESVLELFFGSLYAPTIHVAFQFMALTRALEGLHRVTIGGSYHPDDEYDRYRMELKGHVTQLDANNDWKNKFIRGELQYGNQYSLRKRLKDLLKRMDSALKGAILRDEEGFVDRVVKTRNYLTHMDEKERGNALHGNDLMLAFYKLQILVGVLLLREAGISEPVVLRALSNNLHMKSLLSRGQHI